MLSSKKNLISAIQLDDFLSCYFLERASKIKIKLPTLHHLQPGKSLCEVADIVLVNEPTVRYGLKSLVQFDYGGLMVREGRRRKLRLPPIEEENFKAEINQQHDEKNGGRIVAEDIQNLLFSKFDCNDSISGVYPLLDRLNIVWISGRPKHPKHSEEATAKFKELVPEELKKIQQDYPKVKQEVWRQDESRIGPPGSLSRVWASKGIRPLVVRQKQFLSAYIYAVCAQKDTGYALVLAEANADMMPIHLDLIAENIDEDPTAIILMDHAS